MVAYRDLMFIMICLFTVMSLLMIPAFIYYKKGGAYTTVKSYEGLSLGNMGYSSTECTIVPLDLNKITMSCPYGIISKVYHIGINPSGMTDKDACTPRTES